MTSVSDVLDDYSGNCRTVLEYGLLMKRLVDQAKQPGFSAENFAPLAELIAVDEFERVGNFKEVMDWPQYLHFLISWAPSADWDCSFKRITDHKELVFLELEERSTVGDYSSAVNSLSVYEFTAAGTIRHLDVYLQMALPAGTILDSYEGVSISE